MANRSAFRLVIAVVLFFLFVAAIVWSPEPTETIIGVPVGCAVTPNGCPSSTP
jgi:hypothetical protein